LRILNDPDAFAPRAVETRSGLEIRAPDGGVSNGPARAIRVALRPMEIQILVAWRSAGVGDGRLRCG
jgi:hypothetical protein